MLQTGNHFRLVKVEAGSWSRLKRSTVLADDARWHLLPISAGGRAYLYFRLAAEIDHRAVPASGVIGRVVIDGVAQFALRLSSDDEADLELNLQYAEREATGEIPDILTFQKKPSL